MSRVDRFLPLPALWLCLVLGACQNLTPPGTFFDSSPPGAELRINGQRSGFVTPCLVHLSLHEPQEVRIELEGYLPRDFVLVPSIRLNEVRWRDGAMSHNGLRGVFGLEAVDVIAPSLVDDSLSPTRLFVHLKPEGR